MAPLALHLVDGFRLFEAIVNIPASVQIRNQTVCEDFGGRSRYFVVTGLVAWNASSKTGVIRSKAGIQ
jgi:hypothetical protein